MDHVWEATSWIFFLGISIKILVFILTLNVRNGTETRLGMSGAARSRRTVLDFSRGALEAVVSTKSCWNYRIAFFLYRTIHPEAVEKSLKNSTDFRCEILYPKNYRVALFLHNCRFQIPYIDKVLGHEAHPDVFNGLIFSSSLLVRFRSLFCFLWLLTWFLRRRKWIGYAQVYYIDQCAMTCAWDH
jgi:hypothetical protein